MPRKKHQETEAGRNLHNKKKKAILNAALQVFAKKGYGQAKISEIAEQVQMADGTLYLYFKNKAEILHQLFEENMILRNNQLEKVLENEPKLEERFKKLIDFHIHFTLKNPEISSFLALEMRRHASDINFSPSFHRYLHLWDNMVQQGIASGLFGKTAKPKMVTNMLFGALDQTCLAWLATPERNPADLTHMGQELSMWVQQSKL